MHRRPKEALQPGSKIFGLTFPESQRLPSVLVSKGGLRRPLKHGPQKNLSRQCLEVLGIIFWVSKFCFL